MVEKNYYIQSFINGHFCLNEYNTIELRNHSNTIKNVKHIYEYFLNNTRTHSMDIPTYIAEDLQLYNTVSSNYTYSI